MELEFEWDKGNQSKSLEKHGITAEESEQVFFRPYVLKPDGSHSAKENRFNLIGKTDSGKILFMSFTVRNNKIRIISARRADKKERKIYEET